MISLSQFIIENYRDTKTNSERKEELEAWLKGKKYPDYVETLNKMLEDPKAKTLLQDGFGGNLGNMKFTYSVQEISAKALIPTQNEIDPDKSIVYGLRKVESTKKDFEEPVIIQHMPLITFRGNYVIDGHHRWAEVMALNPEAKMVCFNYDANISIISMLKAVQGSIAAVIADANDNNGKLPSGKSKSNIFDMNEEDLDAYVNETITQQVCNYIVSQNINGVASQEDAIHYVIDNLKSMQVNNYPEHGMPAREDMPQTDKGGTDRKDKTTSLPNKEGSALNKLKDGSFDKDAI